MMTGTRVIGKEPHEFAIGEYGIWEGQGWYARCPEGSLANLTAHTIIEHDDGTITVSPSILVNNSKQKLWHGYLERGIWRED